jgi:uncharacterized membrane protein YfcA
MTDPVWTYTALCSAAFVAGAMNSIAGGGTLLTFPSLMFALAPFGVRAGAIANATSTVALLPGSLAGAWGYKRELVVARSFALAMLAPSLIGGAIGAWLLIAYQQQFQSLVPWLVLSAATLFLIQQPLLKWMKKEVSDPMPKPGPSRLIFLLTFQFLVAVYGGYFGAGIGILMLTALGFMGVGDIHRMNAVKTFLASAINLVSVAQFVAEPGMVVWKYALPMVVSAITGGYVGARVARKLPSEYVRWAVVLIGFGLAVYCFVTRY